MNVGAPPANGTAAAGSPSNKTVTNLSGDNAGGELGFGALVATAGFRTPRPVAKTWTVSPRLAGFAGVTSVPLAWSTAAWVDSDESGHMKMAGSPGANGTVTALDFWPLFVT